MSTAAPPWGTMLYSFHDLTTRFKNPYELQKGGSAPAEQLGVVIEEGHNCIHLSCCTSDLQQLQFKQQRLTAMVQELPLCCKGWRLRLQLSIHTGVA